MAKRKIHKGKSRSSREQYNRYIKTRDYEPTVDDTLSFSQSDQSGEELGEPTSTRKRKVNTKQYILEHLSENWLNYVVVMATIVLVYLMYDSKVDLACIDVNITAQKEDISDLELETKQQIKKNYSQDVDINENRVRLDTLERWVNSDFDKNRNLDNNREDGKKLPKR